MVSDWEVYSEQYGTRLAILDDGTGPMEYGCDWVSVEAPDWRTAMKIGRQKLDAEFPKGWIAQRRSDGLFPYGGIHCRQIFIPIHEPVEEWVGYPMTACGICGVPWPCAESRESA